MGCVSLPGRDLVCAQNLKKADIYRTEKLWVGLYILEHWKLIHYDCIFSLNQICFLHKIVENAILARTYV